MVSGCYALIKFQEKIVSEKIFSTFTKKQYLTNQFRSIDSTINIVWKQCLLYDRLSFVSLAR